MNSKKAITLLVLVTLLVAMVPAIPMASAELIAGNIDITNDDNGALVDSGEKGHTIIVEGAPDSVSSGYEVNLYWGKIQAWDGKKGLLNTTEVDDDGGFEIWFTVPEAVFGEHNLWYTATDQSTSARDTFDVVADTDIDRSSGLIDTNVYVDMWGYDNDEDAGILFVHEDVGGVTPIVYTAWNAVTETAEPVHTATTATVGGHAVVYDWYRPMTTLVTIIADGVTAGTWDGANAFVAAGGANDLVPASCSYVSATNTLNLEFAVALAIGDVIGVTYSAGYAPIAAEVTGETGVAGEDDDGIADNGMIEPGTFTITGATTGTATDAATKNGDLKDDAGTTIGSVDYVTGEWDFDNSDAIGTELTGALTLAYQYFDDIENYVYVLSSSGVTNDLGSWENKRVTIPDAAEGQYYIYGMDGDGNLGYDDFKIGAIITLSEEEGPVGSKVEIEGAGFEPGDQITVTMNGKNVHIIDSEDAGADDNEVDTNGEFVFEVIIPQTDDDDEYEITCADVSGNTAGADYEVTALAKTSVDPDYGPQGSKVTVSGVNFPQVKDTDVDIWLTKGGDVIKIDTVQTDADGTFEEELTVPTENDDTYKIDARVPADDDGAYALSDDVDFRIGTIMVLLSDDEGPAGAEIVLTGNGFTAADEWNATFGDVTIFDEEMTVTGLLKVDGNTPVFYVPQLPAGDYDITVWDVDAEIMIETLFTITDATSFEIDPIEAPAGYNVSFYGRNWSEEQVDTFEFVVYNDTDEWDITSEVFKVMNDGLGGEDDFKTGDADGSDADDGAFNAWWYIGDQDADDAADIFSMGVYNLNVTYGDDWLYQTTFTVGDVHMEIAPRKATFRVGDTVSFDVQHSFGNQDPGDIFGGDIRIYDPSGDLYWDGDPLDEWTKTDMYYSAMGASQTSSTNPWVLLDDAPLGEWSYEWRESGADPDIIAEGTFMVEDSEANVVSGQVADLANQIDELTADLSGVTEDFDDVKSDISGVLAVAQEAVAAANAATEAVNAVATQANNAGAAAEAAQVAAENAANAASGLTTLVYGAIGAALVAALAAIVSLMQISRRIAG